MKSALVTLVGPVAIGLCLMVSPVTSRKRGTESLFRTRSANAAGPRN